MYMFPSAAVCCTLWNSDCRTFHVANVVKKEEFEASGVYLVAICTVTAGCHQNLHTGLLGEGACWTVFNCCDH